MNSASTVSVANLNVYQGTMTDFIRVDTADSFTATGIMKAESVDGTVVPSAYDTTKSGLFSFANIRSLSIDSVTVTTCNLLVSPSLLIDTVASTNIKASNFLTVKVQASDLIVFKKPTSIMLTQPTFSGILNNMANTTRYAVSITNLQLVQGSSFYTISKPSFRTSTVQMLGIKSSTLALASDTTKYPITLEYCSFSNNIFTGYDLVTFADLSSSSVQLVNSFCIPDTSKPTCASATYYDPIQMSCTACPSGCTSCTSGSQCLTCAVPQMTVNALTGLCTCPF